MNWNQITQRWDEMARRVQSAPAARPVGLSGAARAPSSGDDPPAPADASAAALPASE
ncbi:hypothetical protein LV780_18250 [Cereibacter azotoformans]|uniref:Uncharacterized protein n=1 Tax=Cereibacter azotoformans TaxID=43057 RepID=A0A2T5JLJ8_9RHOB|nr:hypothetical protein [Cereibacter azotoformans]PTR07654.1 hypothetical protein C8J28_1397 [Cereibacter azotoformans]UIJ32272.1 hypothetical protein LV780_18250 [Cereibacter azotoformans]